MKITYIQLAIIILLSTISGALIPVSLGVFDAVEVIEPKPIPPKVEEALPLPTERPENPPENELLPLDEEIPTWFVNFIKEKEGFRAKPYYCSGNKLTIGYGFTEKEIISKYKSITKDQAEQLLVDVVLPNYQAKVKRIVKVPLNYNQELALTSFCMNLGEGALRKLVGDGSKNRLNSGNYESIAQIMPKYRKAGGKIREGLVKRRKIKVDLFYTPTELLVSN